MSFNANSYKSMYARFLGPLAQKVTLKKNNGTGFDDYPDIDAFVSQYRERDLVSDGPIRLGDLRLILQSSDVPVPRMDKGDRIEIDGRVYGVIHWDDYTRKMGETPVAIEVAVRG